MEECKVAWSCVKTRMGSGPIPTETGLLQRETEFSGNMTDAGLQKTGRELQEHLVSNNEILRSIGTQIPHSKDLKQMSHIRLNNEWMDRWMDE